MNLKGTFMQWYENKQWKNWKFQNMIRINLEGWLSGYESPSNSTLTETQTQV